MKTFLIQGTVFNVDHIVHVTPAVHNEDGKFFPALYIHTTSIRKHGFVNKSQPYEDEKEAQADAEMWIQELFKV